ncbi:hypothetical protein NPIL_393761 [Nephila pilipes]|uniref:Uncharacterized protein n=1 Tax=Nephila pilipes TaxID=299642 RepID=A0A8X6UIS1_NEPPI|nr:hypothetical protein NPIL_393761 [Nephila pilipes]
MTPLSCLHAPLSPELRRGLLLLFRFCETKECRTFCNEVLSAVADGEEQVLVCNKLSEKRKNISSVNVRILNRNNGFDIVSNTNLRCYSSAVIINYFVLI